MRILEHCSAQRVSLIARSLFVHWLHCPLLQSNVHTANAAAQRTLRIIGTSDYNSARQTRRRATCAKHNEPWCEDRTSHTSSLNSYAPEIFPYRRDIDLGPTQSRQCLRTTLAVEELPIVLAPRRCLRNMAVEDLPFVSTPFVFRPRVFTEHEDLLEAVQFVQETTQWENNLATEEAASLGHSSSSNTTDVGDASLHPYI
jgi:hypothetical protein